MEKSALKMIGCLSTKKKLDTKHHFNLREKKDETIVAFNQLIDISIEKKKRILKIDLNWKMFQLRIGMKKSSVFSK